MIWPNFFIVGASKAGTTSLYNYLNAMNDVYLGPKGKINYFFPEEFDKENAKQEYLTLFKNIKNQKAIGEYADYLNNEKSPNLIKKTIPTAKIIISLRDPIERVFSHYLSAFRGHDEKMNFNAAFEKYMNPIEMESIFYKRYIDAGLYYEKIERFLEVFGKENVLIIIFEEFTKDPRKIFKKVLDFLEIQEEMPAVVGKTYNAYAEPLGDLGTKIVNNKTINKFAKKILSKDTRVTLLRSVTGKKGKKPELNPKCKKYLEEFYLEDSKKLETILGYKLPWEFIRK